MFSPWQTRQVSIIRTGWIQRNTVSSPSCTISAFSNVSGSSPESIRKLNTASCSLSHASGALAGLRTPSAVRLKSSPNRFDISRPQPGA
jgi:hypothetical protein